MPLSDFQPISVSFTVRPPRKLILVPAHEGLDWQQCMEAALAERCRWWGGVGDLVVPLTDDIVENALFWRLADVFDADAYEVSPFDGDHLKLVDPQRFDASVDKRMEREGSSADRVALVREQLRVPVHHPVIPLGLAEALRERVGAGDPDSDDDALSRLGIIDGLDIGELRYVDPPEDVEVPGTSLAPHRLLLAAKTGVLLPSTATRLRSSGVSLSVIGLDEPRSISSAVHSQRSYGLPKTPWSLSAYALATYHSMGSRRRPGPVLVHGDHAWDFALYYALLRLRGGGVWWAPRTVLSDEAMRRDLAGALLVAKKRWGDHVHATSASVEEPFEGLVELGETQVSDTHWRDLIPDRPGRQFEFGSEGHWEPTALHQGHTPRLSTPLPRTVRHVEADRTRWVAEARVEGWSALRRASVSPQVLSGENLGWFQRATVDGVAYDGLSAFGLPGAGLHSSVARPRLRISDLHDQLTEICRDAGWRARRSDKGSYTAHAAELFGGVRGLIGSLRHPVYAPVLAAFLAGKKEPDALGWWISAEQRRVLTFKDLDDLITREGGPHAEVVVERLRRRGVLQLGSVLKCVRCRQLGWYDVDAFGRNFRCSRCREKQEAGRDAWCAPEPQWLYRLDEALLQFLLHDGDLPLLGVRQLLEADVAPVDAAFELELLSPARGQEPERKSELDIAVSIGGRLWIGEATTSDSLAKSKKGELARLSRLRDVALLLGAGNVVLATSHAWSGRANDSAQRIFPGPWPALSLVQGVPTLPRPSRLIGTD